MMDSIGGSTPLNLSEHASVASSDSAPPSGKPAAVSEVKPDVSVAISEMAQARLESMAAPSDANASAAMSMNSGNGGVDFGVDKGGFDWPLDANQSTRSDAAKFDTESNWEARGEVVNGVLLDEANEAAYFALGKSTVSASN